MSKMLKFVDLKRETPEKFGSESRKENFLEIYKEFIDTKAKEQASDVPNVEPFLPGTLSTPKQYT